MALLRCLFFLLIVLRNHLGTNHDCYQDHSHHYSANPKHPALRAVFHLARTRLMPSSGNALNLDVPRFVSRWFPSQRTAQALLAGLLAIGCSFLTVAQSPDQEDIVRVKTDLVAVSVTVVDSNGHRLSGFKQEDFVMSDDGRVVKIGHFSSGTDRVALVFLLDASGSARDYLVKQRDAALALFSRLGPGSQVAVAYFGNRMHQAVPFTDEIIKARAGFDFEAAAEQRSAIFDSAAAAVRMLAQRKSNPTERKIVILTSDGLDNASSTKANEVINCARSESISFYIIHFPLFAPYDGHLVMRPTAKGFRDLAEKTGGRFFSVGDVKLALNPGASYNLSTVFRAIEDDLASQYVLGYYPTEETSNRSDHKVEVALVKSNRHKPHVEILRRLTRSACFSNKD